MATSYFLQLWPVSCHRALSSFQPVLACSASPCRCSPAKLCANVKLRRKQAVLVLSSLICFPNQLLALSKVPCTVCNTHRFDRIVVVLLELRILSVPSARGWGLTWSQFEEYRMTSWAKAVSLSAANNARQTLSMIKDLIKPSRKLEDPGGMNDQLTDYQLLIGASRFPSVAPLCEAVLAR